MAHVRNVAKTNARIEGRLKNIERRLLIIAYYFPPAGSIGYRRPLKFAKYLYGSGWTPFALTVKKPSDKIIDFSLLNNIPKELHVYKATSLEPFRYRRQLYRKFKPQLKNVSYFAFKRLFNAMRFYIFRVIRIFMEKFILIPDEKIGWLPFAFISGLRIINSKKIDIIFATSPPRTSLLIGCLLKVITKKPLIVDYRDPWTFSPFRPYTFKIRRYFEEWLEYRVLKNCDTCITTTNKVAKTFKEKHPQFKEKIITITNGFDPDDFIELKAQKFDKFTLLYSGTFYGDYNPLDFLKALKQLYEENAEVKKNIQFIFIGTMDNDAKNLLSNTGLIKFISSPIRYLPYKENLTHMKGADVLILILNENLKASIPGKLYEYLAVRRPILAIIPEGPAAELIRKTKTGVVVVPKDMSGIKSQILEFYEQYKKNKTVMEYNDKKIMEYSYPILTKKLVTVINKLI